MEPPITLDQIRADAGAFYQAVREVHEAQFKELSVPLARGSLWEVGRKKVNPHLLFLQVLDRGGFEEVSRDKDNWCTVSTRAGIPETQASTLSWQVKDVYREWLLPLEAAMNGPLVADGVGGDARAVRGLRRAPPQRQPFPTPAPVTRQTRSGGNSQATPTNTNNTPLTPAVSSPSSTPTTTTAIPAAVNMDQRTPMYTIQLDTPSNRRGIHSQIEPPGPLPRTVDPLLVSMIPEKTPRIYNHCVKGLACGIPEEVDFALHHLVVISDERGDKFKFEDFPLLAEDLIEKVLDLTILVSGVKWEVDYAGIEEPRVNLLDGSNGTPDLLERIKKFPPTFKKDTVEDEDFCTKIRHITEASLTLRNMSMLEANALWLSDLEIFKESMIILLKTAHQRRFKEIINNMLDTLEQICPYWETDPADPLFDCVIDLLSSTDRYQALTSLRIMILYSMDLDTDKTLKCIPEEKIRPLLHYTLLEQDKELLSGTLDFFYQYTALQDNVEDLLTIDEFQGSLITRLVNLLMFEGEQDINEIVDQEERKAPPATAIPIVPPDLHALLMQYTEPERCSRWLKCCFIEDEECEITQLALWHAYQNCFAEERVPGVTTLPAAEFINTVSRTFSSAQAQVVPGAVAKFIIRGIRPLEAPYDLNGYPYYHCRWNIPEGRCQTAFIDPTKLKEHVFREHMLLDPANLGNLPDALRPTNACAWDTCESHRIPTGNTARVAGHVAAHLPPPKDMSSPPTPPSREVIQPRIVRMFDYYPTPVDEKGEPVGIAYKAILVLRNIIRNLPKGSARPKHKRHSWNYVLFFSYKAKLLEMADFNPTLRADIFELCNEIKSK
ncbi:Chromatin structure-remodeling complex protein rsc9 [Onygenales sp. PD_12]|nr:Chromatin structure-remodeling complex protein rsc9 [Onygenales sp. PD_12]KAK2805749.1 Chromatin structure-remodeling complex protein rsc9 [Onygenales sp. PD_10]